MTWLLDLGMRAGAGCAVGLAAWLVYVVWQRLKTVKLPRASTVDADRHTVLAIQGRLLAAGNDKAAATAYRLLGEMTTGE
jgi:hypothetical protein